MGDPLQEEAALALCDRAWACQTWDPDNAHRFSQRALAQAITLGSTAAVAYAWINVAFHEMHVGSILRGDAALKQIVALGRKCPLSPRLQWLEGLVRLSRTRRCEEALLLERADRLLGDCDVALPGDRLRATSMRAQALRGLGRYEDALRGYFDVLHVARSLELYGLEINATNNVGGMLIDLHDEDDAAPLLEQGLVRAVALPAPFLVGLLAMNLIVCLSAQGRHEEQWALVERHLLGRETRIPCDPMLIECVIARSCLDTGRFEVARLHLDSLRLESNTAIGVNGDLSLHVAWVSAGIHLKRLEYDEALGVCIPAMRAIEQGGPGAAGPYDAMRLYGAACEAYRAKGNLAEALVCMELRHGMYQRQVGRSAKARTVALQVRYDLLRTQDERDGALAAQLHAEDEQQRLTALNERLVVQIDENCKMQQELLELTLTDPLTRLGNRRYLKDGASRLITLAIRHETPLTVALLDIDHFKRLNDECGHAMGDRVLQHLAELMRQHFRETDLICRYGGEEFVLVLPNTRADDAGERVQRLIDALRTTDFQVAGRTVTNVTFSAGLACPPDGGSNLAELLQVADERLYRAKASGRARVERAEAGIETTKP